MHGAPGGGRPGPSHLAMCGAGGIAPEAPLGPVADRIGEQPRVGMPGLQMGMMGMQMGIPGGVGMHAQMSMAMHRVPVHPVAMQPAAALLNTDPKAIGGDSWF